MSSKEGLHDESSEFTTAYALYKYNANRPCSTSAETSSSGTVMDFLQKEAKADGNFSLSLVTSSLKTEYEKDLRLMIASRLSRGTVYSGSGNIAPLKIEQSGDSPAQTLALCYYCLLRQGLPPDPDAQQTDSGSDPLLNTSSYCSNEFVVCFLTKPDVTLDLFRVELDQYSASLLSILDQDPLVFFELDEKLQMEEIAASVSVPMEGWTFHVLDAASRCVHRLQDDVKFLIHAALVDVNIRVVGDGADDQLKKDIQKFVSCCSLSELLSQLVTEPISTATTPATELIHTHKQVNINADVAACLAQLDDLDINTPAQPDVILTITPDSYCFENQDCTEFCASWSQALLSGDINDPVFIRQVIENYKLKAIQDMNTLKRLIRQAETDHYALYRSYVFLTKSGNAPILLRHARAEHHSVTSHDAQDVLSVLAEQILQHAGTRYR